MTALASGKIHGVAVDAGSGLEAAIREARGADAKPDDLLQFKRSVLTTLGPSATTVLVDAACGPDLLADYPDDCAPMLAYEADVYHISDADRITVLPDNLSIANYSELGVGQLKFFMYYAPNDEPGLNARKRDIVAKIGTQCREHNVRFLMEPLVYDRHLTAGSLDYALVKPDLVRRATEAFADPSFCVDVLKVEVPVDLNFVEGFGQSAMTRTAALAHFRQAAAAAGGIPLVYLSAGVPFDQFEASLAMAREAGVEFAGFMCGRAIWSDAIGIFGERGADALGAWLTETGRDRMQRLIAAAG